MEGIRAVTLGKEGIRVVILSMEETKGEIPATAEIRAAIRDTRQSDEQKICTARMNGKNRLKL